MTHERNSTPPETEILSGVRSNGPIMTFPKIDNHSFTLMRRDEMNQQLAIRLSTS